MKVLKVFNYFIAMVFTLIPVIIYREYSNTPNNYMFYQTLYVTLSYWIIIPIIFKLVKNWLNKDIEDIFKSIEAIIMYVITLIIWLIVSSTNK